jgi:hypothetical protein
MNKAHDYSIDALLLAKQFDRLGVTVDQDLWTDPAMLERLAGTWSVSNTGYVVRKEPNGSTTFLHKLILADRLAQLPPGRLDEIVVDHINGNRLDNRRSELRIATPLQNARNHCTPTNNSSGQTGVSWNEKRGRWRAKLARRELGYFQTYEEAVEARLVAERQWGPFAPSARQQQERVERQQAEAAALDRFRRAYESTEPAIRHQYDPHWVDSLGQPKADAAWSDAEIAAMEADMASSPHCPSPVHTVRITQP